MWTTVEHSLYLTNRMMTLQALSLAIRATGQRDILGEFEHISVLSLKPECAFSVSSDQTPCALGQITET